MKYLLSGKSSFGTLYNPCEYELRRRAKITFKNWSYGTAKIKTLPQSQVLEDQLVRFCSLRGLS